MRRLLTLALIVVVPMAVAARQFQLGGAVRPFIAVDAGLLALTNARVIDGTGGPPREGQTIVIRDGKIVEVVAAGRVPEGARAIDVTGKTIIPGIVRPYSSAAWASTPQSSARQSAGRLGCGESSAGPKDPPYAFTSRVVSHPPRASVGGVRSDPALRSTPQTKQFQRSASSGTDGRLAARSTSLMNSARYPSGSVPRCARARETTDS
jgi:hypothetical protein